MKILNHIPLVQAYRNRHEPESLRELADIYWKTLAVLSTILVTGFVVYDLWQFREVSKILSTSQQQSQETNPLDVMPFKREEVKAVTEGFAKRQSANQLYSVEAPAITDPSR